MLNAMVINAKFNAEQSSLMLGDYLERIKDKKRGKRQKQCDNKKLQIPVPRAAAAYGRQLKILLVF